MKVLCVLGGGIGNIVQSTPSLQAAIRDKFTIDLMLHCNSSNEFEIFNIRGVRNIFTPNNPPTERYDFQVNGPFTPGYRHNAKSFHRVSNYARHYPESDLYYDLFKKIGVKSPKQYSKIKIINTGQKIKEETVAIYPGSKHTWAMKRWDKYDKLAKHFDRVLLVGTKKDIESHGDPAWIKKKWEWPSHVKTFTGTLQQAAWVIKNCKMFIGNDGGLAHVAAATGTPTYIIFGPSSVVKNAPYNKNVKIIQYSNIKPKLDCQPCQFGGHGYFNGGKIGCPFGMKCMADLSVEDVLKVINNDN